MLNILGIDYGSKRVGLALGDPEKKMAFPFEVIENKNRKYLLEKIKDVCLRENIKEVVV
ncbi:MAG TPA: Holliday junction resolvase RuvX, partial [Patescibacteria group bacterium]